MRIKHFYIFFALLISSTLIYSQSTKERIDDIEFLLLLEQIEKNSRKSLSNSNLLFPIIPYMDYGTSTNGDNYMIDTSKFYRSKDGLKVILSERRKPNFQKFIDSKPYKLIDSWIAIDCIKNKVKVIEELYANDYEIVKKISSDRYFDILPKSIYSKYKNNYCP
jgi:hypothetical protein